MEYLTGTAQRTVGRALMAVGLRMEAAQLIKALEQVPGQLTVGTRLAMAVAWRRRTGRDLTEHSMAAEVVMY